MSRDKEKGNIENNNNQFIPDRKQYCFLLCLTIIITIACFAIPQESAWFNIGTGIGCSGIASVIVAWLIDEANSKKEIKRVNTNREILFKKLLSSFKSGLQILIFKVEKNIQDNSPRKWFEWIESAYMIADSVNGFWRDYQLPMMLFFNDVSESIYELEAQSAVLLEHGLISKEDIEALSIVLSMCELAKKEINSSMDEIQSVRNIKTYCGLIKAAIDYSVNLYIINEMEIEPILYNKYEKYKGLEE